MRLLFGEVRDDEELAGDGLCRERGGSVWDGLYRDGCRAALEDEDNPREGYCPEYGADVVGPYPECAC